MADYRPSGHVAHCQPGSVVLTEAAIKLLASHLQQRREPDDARTNRVVADLIRLSRLCPVSRDKLPSFLESPPGSEITTTEAASILGLTPAGVRKRIQRNQIPARFDGTRWTIHRHDLEGQRACSPRPE